MVLPVYDGCIHRAIQMADLESVLLFEPAWMEEPRRKHPLFVEFHTCVQHALKFYNGDARTFSSKVSWSTTDRDANIQELRGLITEACSGAKNPENLSRSIIDTYHHVFNKSTTSPLFNPSNVAKLLLHYYVDAVLTSPLRAQMKELDAEYMQRRHPVIEFITSRDRIGGRRPFKPEWVVEPEVFVYLPEIRALLRRPKRPRGPRERWLS
jgi:hypothetical protein